MCSDVFFLFKQKTAYEMRISDWSSDVCSSDLRRLIIFLRQLQRGAPLERRNPQIDHPAAVTDVARIDTLLPHHARFGGERAVAVEPQVEHGDDLVRARAGIDLTIGTGLDLAADRGFEPGEHL